MFAASGYRQVKVLNDSYCGNIYYYYDKIVVSSDGSLWATFCTTTDTVLIGNTRDPEQYPTLVRYMVNGKIKDLAWLPNSSTIVISTSG